PAGRKRRGRTGCERGQSLSHSCEAEPRQNSLQLIPNHQEVSSGSENARGARSTLVQRALLRTLGGLRKQFFHSFKAPKSSLPCEAHKGEMKREFLSDRPVARGSKRQ